MQKYAKLAIIRRRRYTRTHRDPGRNTRENTRYHCHIWRANTAGHGNGHLRAKPGPPIPARPSQTKTDGQSQSPAVYGIARINSWPKWNGCDVKTLCRPKGIQQFKHLHRHSAHTRFCRVSANLLATFQGYLRENTSWNSGQDRHLLGKIMERISATEVNGKMMRLNGNNRLRHA